MELSLKLVAIDLDSTLLRDDKSYDMERFDKVAKELINKGVIFVIASGNKNPKIRSYISDNLLEEVYVAGCNGNDVELNGDHIHTNYFNREALFEIAALVDSDDDLQMVLDTSKATYSKYIYEEDKDYISIYYKEIIIIDRYEDLPEDEEPIKTAILSSKPLDETKQIVNRIVNDIEGVTAVTSGGGWLDAYHEDGGKGSAIEWLQKTKNIKIDETIAFGDSLNDSSMMPYAKYSVAMKNGDDDFKSYCDYEIGTNEEQSVIEVLETYLVTDNLDFMEQHKK